MSNVADLKDGDFDVYLVVGGVRKVAAQVMVEPGGATRNADDTEIARHCRLQYARVLQAVEGGRGIFDEVHERVEFGFQPGH